VSRIKKRHNPKFNKVPKKLPRKEKERNFQGKKLPTSSKEVRRKFSVPTEATASINTTSKLTASINTTSKLTMMIPTLDPRMVEMLGLCPVEQRVPRRTMVVPVLDPWTVEMLRLFEQPTVLETIVEETERDRADIVKDLTAQLDEERKKRARAEKNLDKERKMRARVEKQLDEALEELFLGGL
jgi:hypothetical protein